MKSKSKSNTNIRVCGLLIHWNQLKTKEQFCERIANIAQTIRIKFYKKYVLELLSKWNIENKKLVNLDKN